MHPVPEAQHTHIAVRDAKVLAVFSNAVQLTVWLVFSHFIPAIVSEVKLLQRSKQNRHLAG
jgi:hypothetical protein